MWQQSEIDALKVGLSLDYFWGAITPKEYLKHVKAYVERLEDQRISTDYTNWLLGMYIGSAVGDIFRKEGTMAKYPKKPHLQKTSTLNRVYTKEETEAFLRGEMSNV